MTEQPLLLSRRGPAGYQGTQKGWGPWLVPVPHFPKLPFLLEAPGGPVEEEEA